jgi:phosphoglycolate phosphatase-like HAD superfamily hydrolase
MSDPQAALKNMPKKHDFLVAIDSDGCAFDSMEIKHKECFIPNIVKYWDLQPVSKFTRAAAEFVNLYSKWRGINRFPALMMVFDLLQDWPDVQRRGASIPTAQPVRDWIARETKLGNPALKAEVQKTGDPVLKQALAWSEAVNAAIADMVHDVPPFPFVRESLEKISEWADILVCSATPGEALVREWEEHGISRYVAVIAGQELGSKKEHIHMACGGRWEHSRILMIGDAPGDMKAARGNNALFFPINPGAEDGSWELFLNEAADRFRNGQYTAEYEGKLIAEFDKLLPELPPWKQARGAAQ